MIQRIKENINGLQLEANVILKFFKICSILKLELKNIENIELYKNREMELNKENYLTSDDINNLVKKEKEKIKLIDLIVKIYTNYDKKH